MLYYYLKNKSPIHFILKFEPFHPMLIFWEAMNDMSR